jgi:hypothetical protein
MNIFFLTMYFGLPEYTPPRPLGEAEVRKQWSTKYTGLITLNYIILYYDRHPNPDILPPLPPSWGRASIFMYSYCIVNISMMHTSYV